ncbi:MAG: hypothetical protein H0V21_06115 [Rubrobacter sp.]|nr:hypothetical protein [Rubrobacter sp.]
MTPDTQLVMEGFPRSANSFARVAFNRAQKEKGRIANGLHGPTQENKKRQLGYELEDPRLGALSSRAEAVYDRLTSQTLRNSREE